MTRTPLLAFAAMLLVAVSSCGQQTKAAAPIGQSPETPTPGTAAARVARSGEGVPYHLSTHCGIEWAKIRGTFWHTEQLSDGNGNPPQGWGNPYQSGRLVFQSATTATFVSDAGQVVLHRTSRSEPPFVCS